MNIINKLTIKHKTYILVLLSVSVALILSLVSNNGLRTIRLELDYLIFASNIERYTTQLLVEEQKYRLNVNGSLYNFEAANQAYNNTINYIDKIYNTLDEIDSLETSVLLQEYQKKTHDSTSRYKILYLKGVGLLTELNKQATILVVEGEEITHQIQSFVEAKRIEVKQQMTQETIEKINNGSNIWQFTYVTRLHEETYRLSPSNKVFTTFKKDFKFMMSEWQRLKAMSDQKVEFETLDKFKIAAQKYKKAMLLWVDLHQQLVNDVLPKMIDLGKSVIANAIQSVENSVKHMSYIHDQLVITLLTVSSFTIIFGIFLGVMIARSITSTVSSFKSGLLNFFQYLNQHNQQKESIQPIIVKGRNEISMMAEVVNDHIIKVQDVIKRKESYQQALLQWSKVDYQDDNITTQKATELSAKALNIERVSIWFFNNDKKLLTCADLYKSDLSTHESGILIAEKNYPEFFKALCKGKMLVIEDARNDQRTRELKNNYLIPFDIYSILYLPIVNDGQFVGVICYEKKGKKKSWKSDELDFAKSMVYAISLSLEIKKRHLIQQELKALFNQIPSGVAVYEAVDNGDDFIFKNFNRAAEQIENVKRDDLLGKRVKDVFPGIEEFGLFKVFQKVWKSGISEAFTDEIYKDDNSISSCRDNWVYKLPSGDIVAVYNDVTARKQAEEQSALISTVYENTSEAIIITDADSHIINCNQAYTDITGYSLEEVKGKNPNITCSGQHDKEFYTDMWKSVKESGSWSGELWDQRKNGEVFPKWLSINAVLNRDAKPSHYVGVFTDITNQKAVERELETLAFKDTLTGLPNRQLFQERLDYEIKRAHRDNSQMALIFMDLDKFKLVNDSLGHHVGDELLQQVAQRLQASVRENDTIARLGGDEFTIILCSINSPSVAAAIAEKIIEAISLPFILHGHEIFVGASLGISLYPDDCHDKEFMLRNADAAMYHAKEKGRGNFQFFSEEINLRNQQRLLLEHKLRQAIKNKEFELYYQPQINIINNTVIGSEVLIRWNEPNKGLISPLDFIPIAEETGLILEIGAWVFQQACAQLRSCMDSGKTPVRVAINLSAVQFRDEGLFEMISSTIKQNNIATKWIELEVTESAVMENADEAIMILEKLSALGIRISIDDFGTGYSSLAYLKKFPVDKLKIDREFIRDLPNDDDDVVLTTTMINLANSLGIDVLAEGVETKEQIEFLRKHGCHYIQGYYYSKPLPYDEFMAYITSIS
ncbi:MAG: EAL domain-containing protein [Pseudomonadota bacterium]